MAEQSLPKKLNILIKQCKNHDEGTQAVAQFIATESKERMAAFAFATCLAAVMGKLPIGGGIFLTIAWSGIRAIRM